MDFENEMTITFKSISQNEALARISISAFVAQLDPTIDELTDIKTAVSEAVTNAIIHGYNDNAEIGKITLHCNIHHQTVFIEVIDHGMGIADIEEARQPLFTSKPHLERSGMGFTVMETFMDQVEVISSKDNGTKIVMSKKIHI